jgi:hypothetical protein
MPTYFCSPIAHRKAAELGLVITDQASKADYFRSIAYGGPADSGRGGLMREAIEY